MAILKISYLFCIVGILAGCSGLEESEQEKIRKTNVVAERIYRSHDEILFAIKQPKRRIRENYPWENAYMGNHIRITKEFFRCKGSTQNAPHIKTTNGQKEYTFDCGGMQQHSLPLREGKEFIYPALIDLLNYIQEKTQKKVIITCGHRCPTHNTYSDPSKSNQTSKHMIGAEVDFYVKGLEESPKTVLALLEQYYQEHPKFKNQSAFTKFERYQNETKAFIPPWYNKEIFVRLYKRDEGRDLENNHRFPYISIQLKWDRDTGEPVSYSWSKAFNSYLRY